MTDKPKMRKAAPKAASPKGTPQNKTEIELLIARYKWLEADQRYQAAIAKTCEESDRDINLHEPELDKIATKLAALAPTSHQDIFLLLEFVAPSLKDGCRCDGLEVDIMRNVLDSFYSVLADELASERMIKRPIMDVELQRMA